MEKKETIDFVKDFVSNKKFQIIATIIVFLLILISSTNIRLSNLDNLKDETDGQYTLADLDALYFLRLSEVVLNTGSLSGIDSMRYIPLDVGYSQEIMPYVVVGIYKLVKTFSPETTLRYINAISPAIFYAFGLTLFFFLIYTLTKSKSISLLSSAFLAYNQAYLFRTMSGVSDHEAIGMIPFFAALLLFVIAIKKFNLSWKNTFIWSTLVGVITALTMASWGGALTFLLMIYPLATLIYFLFNLEDEDFKSKERTIIFSILWIIVASIVAGLLNFSFTGIFSKLTNSYGLIVPFVIGLMIVDYLYTRFKTKLPFIRDKFRLIYSLGTIVLLGIVSLTFMGKNIFEIVGGIYIQLLHPFGLGRTGLTVAENAQPYLTDWMGQNGQIIFWFFILGMIYFGIEIAKKIKTLRHSIYFSLSWTAAIIGILFSRISSSSTLNGTNFISEVVYVLGLGLFVGYFGWLYFNDRFKLNEELIFIFAWMIFMLISGRSAIRTIFAVTPFVCFAAAYFVVKTYAYLKNFKGEVSKYFFLAMMILAVILSFISLFVNVSPISKNTDGSYAFTSNPGSYQLVSMQAQYIGSSTNSQWQNAMAWVRNNTGIQDIFVHWWDYGYFVQTLGLRPTVTDGGHANGYWDHLTGRYLLTTPYPETALSFMKSQNVSYLLIDPSDLGKYGAYSKIGGDKNNDRFSSPQVIVADEKQTIETSTGIKKVYVGSTFVDEDINYNGTFLPGTSFDKYDLPTYRSYFLGVLMSSIPDKVGAQIEQPIGVFSYKNKQYQLPVRYVYYEGQLIDFKSGINSTIRLIPTITQNSNGQINLDRLGAGIYLSKKVSEGLFARLYLMDDPFNQYPTIKIAHSEPEPVVKQLAAQGINLGDFIYFNGLRAPLKIWKVEYPNNTLIRSEFVAENGGYGELDGLQFTA